MSHQEKQSIFDEYAKSQGFKDWEDVQTEYHLALMSDDELKLYIFAACDLVQEEQQKRIAEKVLVKITDIDRYGNELTIEEWGSNGFPLNCADGYPDCNIVVNEDSIINPENKIQ